MLDRRRRISTRNGRTGSTPKRTRTGAVPHRGGTVENVPTMHLDGAAIESGPRLGYAAGTGWKAVALPYEGNQLEMDVVVPDDLHAFESTFGRRPIASVLGALQPANVVLSMPKFDVSADPTWSLPSSNSACTTCSTLDRADLSGIDGRPDLFVSAVKQKVVVARRRAGHRVPPLCDTLANRVRRAAAPARRPFAHDSGRPSGLCRARP